MSIKNKIKKVINFLLKEEHRTTVIVKKADPSCLLKGKRVIITGGNRGLGFEIAKKCIEEKAEVLIVGRNECSLKETSNILNCEYAVCDISNIKSVEKFFENISKYFNGNKVDCLINNAGVYAFNVNNFHDVTEKIWDDLFNVNLKGSYFMTKYFVEYLEKQSMTDCVRWLKASSEQGNAEAQWRLGYFMIEGIGITKDIVKGKEWVEKAALQGDEMALEMLAELKKGENQSTVNNSSNSSTSGGCYVATAVYGSYDCPQVWR